MTTTRRGFLKLAAIAFSAAHIVGTRALTAPGDDVSDEPERYNPEPDSFWLAVRFEVTDRADAYGRGDEFALELAHEALDAEFRRLGCKFFGPRRRTLERTLESSTSEITLSQRGYRTALAKRMAEAPITTGLRHARHALRKAVARGEVTATIAGDGVGYTLGFTPRHETADVVDEDIGTSRSAHHAQGTAG